LAAELRINVKSLNALFYLLYIYLADFPQKSLIGALRDYILA